MAVAAEKVEIGFERRFLHMLVS
jgi:hypothetical protein